jgi:hypothetical protein
MSSSFLKFDLDFDFLPAIFHSEDISTTEFAGNVASRFLDLTCFLSAIPFDQTDFSAPSTMILPRRLRFSCPAALEFGPLTLELLFQNKQIPLLSRLHVQFHSVLFHHSSP